MIMLACFTALGFAAGFVLRLPVFTVLLLLAVVGYAVFSDSIEGAFRLAYNVRVARDRLPDRLLRCNRRSGGMSELVERSSDSYKQFVSEDCQPEFE